ncbi:MAG: hypothetical protein AAFN70_10640 [Planctomycetota bacterium]
MRNRIVFHGSTSMAVKVARDCVAALTGAQNRHTSAARSVHTVIGFALLSSVKSDFVRKARGGTGDDGIKWPPLSPKTLAYSRNPPAGARRGYAPGGKSGLLTKAQLNRWNEVYRQQLARFAMSLDLGAAKSRAAAFAWKVIKSEGGKTKLGEWGNRPHEILRDTGVLLNSLSPGTIGGDNVNLQYVPPAAPGGNQQVFVLRPAGIIVGTNVPYASTHQNGDPKRNIPARPFLPPNALPKK